MVNKTTQPIHLTLQLENLPGRIEIIGKNYIAIEKEGQGAGTFFVILPKKQLHNRKTEIKLALYEGNKKIAVEKTNFLGPVND
jgi:hypothetical protein